MSLPTTTYSNVEYVINSIEDFMDDLYEKLRRRLNDVMNVLQRRARQYVSADADYTGNLKKAIKKEENIHGLQFEVFTDNSIAPYAPIIEYGSGKRTNMPWEKSETPPPTELSTPDGFPYKPPGVKIDTPPESDKYTLTGYSDYAGFANYIERWMETKPVTAKSGDITTSAIAISWEIINKGNLAHPFMRPAWFKTELQVRQAARNALKSAAI